MRIKSRLYNTIVGILSQHQNWPDKRHMYTLAWMVVGVIHPPPFERSGSGQTGFLDLRL